MGLLHSKTVEKITIKDELVRNPKHLEADKLSAKKDFIEEMQRFQKRRLTQDSSIAGISSLASQTSSKNGLSKESNDILNKTVKACEQFIAKDENNIEVYKLLGSSLFLLQRYEDAKKQFEKIVEKDPCNVYAHYYIGNCRYKLGYFEKALNDYEKVVELDPGNFEAYQFLGICYYKSEKLDKAKDYFKKSIDISPHDGNAYYNLGRVLFEQNNFDEAIQNYKKAAMLEASYTSHAYNDLGEIYFKKGKFSEAIEYYNFAIKLNPNSILSLKNRALAYNRTKNLEKANEDILAIQELRSKYFN